MTLLLGTALAIAGGAETAGGRCRAAASALILALLAAFTEVRAGLIPLLSRTKAGHAA